MDPATIASLIGTGIQGAGSLFNMFGPNPAKKAMKHLQPVEGYGREAYNPFIQQGQMAQQQLTPQYQQMMQNPQGFYDQALQGYKPSAGYQYKLGQLQNAGHNTAAAGGYLGTDYDVNRRNEGIHGLLGTDMDEYLARIFGLQGAGMQGLEGQAGRGFTASGNLADYLGTNASNKAMLQGAGTQYGNQGMTSGLASLASLIGGFKMPGTTGQTTEYNPLSSGVADYMRAQSPMAASSRLFSGGR